MQQTEEKYDPVIAFVEAALSAEDRGGVSVKKTINDKLKHKLIHFSTNGTSARTTIDFNSGAKKRPNFSCGKISSRRGKFASLESKASEGFRKCLPSNLDSLAHLQEIWKNYWDRQYKVMKSPRKILGRRFVFTGCELQVTSSPCKHEVGVCGVVVRETRHTFLLCKKGTKQKLAYRRVPKCKRTFLLVSSQPSIRALDDHDKSEQSLCKSLEVKFRGDDIIDK